MSSQPPVESNDALKDLVQLMAADLAYRMEQDRKEREKAAQKKNFKLNLSWLQSGDFKFLMAIGVCGVALYYGSPVLRQVLKVQSNTEKAVDKAGSVFFQGGKPLKTGDKLPSGFVVTSGKGWRVHPVTGRKTFHNGVDINTPVGTTINAPFPGTATNATNAFCGKGLVLTKSDQSFRIGLCHLEYAHFGSIKQGEILAKSGGQPGDPDAGSSTGPHLHITASRCKVKRTNNGPCPDWELVTPTQELLNRVLHPKKSDE